MQHNGEYFDFSIFEAIIMITPYPRKNRICSLEGADKSIRWMDQFYSYHLQFYNAHLPL